MSGAQSFDRRAAVKALTAACPDVLAIADLGSSAYDLFAAGDRDLNYYLWGAMGCAASMGLGLALAQPEKAVLVLTGDGEQLMGLGTLATIGAQQPNNRTIVVFDNGHFGETGMQASHTFARRESNGCRRRMRTCLDDGDRGNFGTAKSCRAHQREESLRSGAHSRECRRTAQGLASARRRIPEESLSRRAGIAAYLGEVEIRGRKRESKIR